MRFGRLHASLVGLAVVAAAVGIGWYALSPEREAVQDLRGQSTVSVVLTDQGFEPQQIRITKGSTVTFSTTRGKEFWPASNAHPSHTIYPEFDPKVPISPNETWSYTFTKSGTWEYHDHVRSYFTGTIDVLD